MENNLDKTNYVTSLRIRRVIKALTRALKTLIKKP